MRWESVICQDPKVVTLSAAVRIILGVNHEVGIKLFIKQLFKTDISVFSAQIGSKPSHDLS